MLVVLSFSDRKMMFKAPEGFDITDAEIAMCNYNDPKNNGNGCILNPYEARVYMLR